MTLRQNTYLRTNVLSYLRITKAKAYRKYVRTNVRKYVSTLVQTDLDNSLHLKYRPLLEEVGYGTQNDMGRNEEGIPR
jgi:hypothetical protein